VSGTASVEPGEQLRVFCALRLPDVAVERLMAWQARAFANDARVRVVRRDQLHVTLAFLGRRAGGEIPAIAAELRAAAGGAPVPTLAVRRYQETRSVGMLVCEDEFGAAGALARELHERLERLGVYERERREWLPHVTVVRFRERPRLSPPLPELEPFVTSDAAVYMSVLRPSGAQYSVLESVAIGR
jgi:RNA 2',3'-cyclic 3'-phosphodiesterase